MLSNKISPEHLLALGPFTGYSAICLARGLQKGGKLVTVEIDDQLKKIASEFFAKAKLTDRIEQQIGPALEIIPKLEQTFDLVFLDADKREYIDYYNAVFPKIRTGGYITADNKLGSGRVLEDLQIVDEQTRGIMEFNDLINNDERVEKEATALGYNIVETNSFQQNSGFVPGLGSNKSLIQYSFEMDKNEVTPVFKFETGYVVAMVSEIEQAGYQPIDEVKQIITNKARREKKADKAQSIAVEAREKIGSGDDLNIAKEVYPKAKVASVNNYPPSGVVPGLGREFKFAQKSLELPVFEISDPFKGNKGSFILKVTSKTPFDSTSYSIQKNTIRNILLNQKRSSIFSQWIEGIKEEADVVDNRHQFYR